jgi:hypothetical protein
MTKRAAAYGVVFLCLAGSTSPARAACRVAFLPFLGPGASDLQVAIVASLPPGCVAVAGRRGAGPGSSVDLSRELGVGAFVDGHVWRARVWHLKIWVRPVGEGARQALWSGRRFRDLVTTVQRAGRPALRQMLLDGAGNLPQAPPASGAVARAGGDSSEGSKGEAAARSEEGSADSKAAAASKGAAESGGSDDKGSEGPAIAERAPAPSNRPILEMSVGPWMLSRTFTYTDNLSNLPGYTLAGTLGVAGEGEIYPTTSASQKVDLGVAGHFDSAVGAKTNSADGTRRDTKMLAYRIGGRIRVPARSFLFALGLDYGRHQFIIDADNRAPNVNYSFVRPSVRMRIETTSKLSLTLTGAYLDILQIGGLNDQSRFPRITAQGAEFDASVGYEIDDSLEVRLTIDLRHYAQTMHVNPGDPYIAGGALDEHFGGGLMIAYRIR